MKRKNTSIRTTLKNHRCIIISIISGIILYIGNWLLNIYTMGTINILLGIISLGALLIFSLSFGFVIYDLIDKCFSKLSTKQIIEKHLSSTFSEVYINPKCLKKSVIPFHAQRTYKAKLEDNGEITIRIENEYSADDFLETKTSDYSWFLTFFNFTE